MVTGVAMTLLQLGIGTTNDVVDAPRDADRKPGKPIPAGLVRRGAAIRVAVACFLGGLALAWTRSAAAGALGGAVVAIGLAYDLRLKGTAWSWLPFAVGIPILPVFGWLAVRSDLPASFAVLVPVAVLGGAALAIGNALVDVERDRAAGATSIAAALGAERAGLLAAGLFVAIWVAAVTTSVLLSAPGAATLLIAIAGMIAPAAAAVARSATPAGRERAWQVEAIGTAALAIVWLSAVSWAGRLF